MLKHEKLKTKKKNKFVYRKFAQVIVMKDPLFSHFVVLSLYS